MKALRWIALGAGALALVVAAVIAIVVLTFDPKAYTARVAELVKRQTGRTVTVDGPVGLAFFPKLGVSVAKVTLSEPNRAAVFARVEEAHVAVALWPLLSRRVVADRLTLKGLAVDLVRGKDGRTNFDDLTGPAAGPTLAGESSGTTARGLPVVLDVGGVEIENASIGWRDEADGTNLRLSALNATTGRLASGAPGTLKLAAHVKGVQPAADLRLELKAAYRVDLGAGTVAMSAVDAKMTGQAQPLGELEARVASQTIDLDPKAGRATISGLEIGAKTARGLDARLTVPRLVLAADRVESAALAGTIDLAVPPRRISAKLRTEPLTATKGRADLSRVDVDFTATLPDLSVQGRGAAPLRLDLEARRAELPAITGDLTVTGKALPNPARGTVRGSGRADWGAESAGADLAIAIDGSRIDAKLAVAHWGHPAITFSVAADRLDVDRYFPPAKPTRASAGGPGGGAATGSAAPGKSAAEEPFDLSPLRGFTATGTVKLGSVRVSNVSATQVALAVRAAGGVVHVESISAALYQGALAGTAVVNANDSSVAVKQRLTGVSMGPFLRDFTNEDVLEGRGDIALDVTAAGKTVGALKRSLAGTAGVVIKDGALKGVDVPAIVGAAQTLLGSGRALERPAQVGARTAFSELAATFQIRRGVARNEDLRVTSPLLRITGHGDVDVGAGTVNYTTKATFTAAPSAVGNELARLAGMTVPIHATGPLANPTYQVDVAALAVENAKTLVPRELQRRFGGDKPDGQQGGGAVGDLLRDLIGGKPKPPK